MAIAEHLIATTRGGDRSLLEPERARWLWSHLQRVLWSVWSAVLMPDHLHLVAALGQVDALRKVLTAFTQVFGVRMDVRPPERATTPAIAGRQIRYGFANPPRAGLVDDPYEHLWSTLRDLSGAAYPIWTPLPDVARLLRTGPTTALRALTSFGDFAVPPLGRTLPTVASIDAVQAAIAAALRLDPRGRLDQPVGRALAIQTLLELGVPSGRRLADLVGCTAANVRRIRAAPPHPALPAVLRCLADPRLRPADATMIVSRTNAAGRATA